MNRCPRGLRQAAPAVLAAGLGLLAACRPAAPAPPQPGDTVFFVPNTEHLLALTFDDGPNGACTEQVLAALEQFRASATFFLLGTNVLRQPGLARRIAAAGHEVGHHSFCHPRLDRMTTREILRELPAGAAAVTETTGVRPLWFRPPFGINGPGLDEICRMEGWFIAGWSAQAGDWNPQTAAEIAERVVSQATPGNIILLHDGWETHPDADRRSTAAAVPLILERLQADGFRFVTLSELRRRAGPPLAEFVNGVRLLGLHAQRRPLPPGGAVYTRYFWELPPGRPLAGMSAFVHIQHADGFMFQDDHGLPRGGDVRDRLVERVLVVPASAPPGRYQVAVGLFDARRPGDSGARVRVRSALRLSRHAVLLPDFLAIQAPPAAAPAGESGP